MALNLGGGTRWETTRTLRSYLDRYHQFDASSGSLGMDDIYGGRVEAFRKALASHLERGLWCRIHYQYIGENLSSSDANFRAVLDIAKEHQDKLWIAGMADIHKYQTERNASKLSVVKADERSLTFQLSVSTDASLHDQPLTLEVEPSPAWNAQQVIILDQQGSRIPSETGGALRFVIPPRASTFVVRASP